MIVEKHTYLYKLCICIQFQLVNFGNRRLIDNITAGYLFMITNSRNVNIVRSWELQWQLPAEKKGKIIC